MDNFANLLIQLPVLIFSVVCHEVAHGWVARREGDNTAFMLGRITLNPLPHIDPIGSILVPGLLALTGANFMFGWAKPVPVNSRNFRNYRAADIRVSLAGVAVNLLLAILSAVLLVPVLLLARSTPDLQPTLMLVAQMLVYGVGINLVLMLFNLLPIPPLDGSHVMYHLLPPSMGAKYRQVGQYGMLLLIVLLATGMLSTLFFPAAWLTAQMVGIASNLAGI